MATLHPLRSSARTLLLIASTLCCTAALAQWQWVDSTGRKVFSDTPPPASVPEKSIQKRPGFAPAPAATESASAPAAAAPAAPAAPKLSGRDEQLEAKKKQAEAEEAAKKKAEADKVAKARQDNCDRAKRAKVTLDSGIRIATTNAQGEREIMDDKARAAESQRINTVIQADCGTAAQ